MKTVLAVIGGVALSAALAIPPTASANMLFNGSLESTLPPDQFNLISATAAHNANAINGWTITSGAVDVVPKTYWQNTLGNTSVDLIGSPGVGRITQTIATTIGETYQFTFDFAVNPENVTHEIGSTKRLLVTAIGSNSAIDASQTFAGTVGTRTLSNMQFVQETMTFTATSSSTKLSLAALMPTGLPGSFTSGSVFSGPVVDNLQLEIFTGRPVPEPASLAVLGVGALALMRRRSRRRS